MLGDANKCAYLCQDAFGGHAAAPQATNAGQACLLVLAQMASVSTKWPKPLLGA